MKVIKQINVPTGEICIVEGAMGNLEMLSLGDYGKDVNLKANFLGLNRTPGRVRHTKLLPLEEKWVVTISTQYGCSMGCTFCDVPVFIASKEEDLGRITCGNAILSGLMPHESIPYTEEIKAC